ncbi:MAG: 30S ribosomal protein S20 [Campylobacteraceae bacterium]|nr:30S ribosomal protein S20 [Campylobacteraceae bacterium]
MANHKSAEKRARQTEACTARNRFYRTRMKNLTKAVRSAIEAGDKEAATVALKAANQNLHSYVSRGFLKKNSAARKVSRLTKAVNTLNTAAN